MNSGRLTLSGYLVDNDLFTEIEKVESFPFIGSDSDELKYMLAVNYGQRFMFTPMVIFPIADIAKQIVKLYSTKWKALIDFNNTPMNLGASVTKKGNTSTSNNTNRDTVQDSVDKTAAYNTQHMFDTSGNNFSESVTTKGDIVNTSTDETFNLKTAFDNLSLVEKTNIIGVVLKDVANYLTVSVY